MNEIKGFVGTYAPAKGIYSFLYDVQKDAFVKTDLFYPVKDAKYLSYYKTDWRFPHSLRMPDSVFLRMAESCLQDWKTVPPVMWFRMRIVFTR